MLKHNKKLAKALKGKRPNSKAYRDAILKDLQEKFAKKEEVHDIALLMVKQLANKLIKVDSAWEGKVAQRYWYLEAREMVKQYIYRVKNHYKNIK